MIKLIQKFSQQKFCANPFSDQNNSLWCSHLSQITHPREVYGHSRIYSSSDDRGNPSKQCRSGNDAQEHTNGDGHTQSNANKDFYIFISNGDKVCDLVWKDGNISKLISDFDSNLHIQGDDIGTNNSSDSDDSDVSVDILLYKSD